MGKAKSINRVTGNEIVEYIQYSRAKNNFSDIQIFTNDNVWLDKDKLYLITDQVDQDGDILSLEVKPGDYLIKDRRDTYHLYSENSFINQYKLLIH